MAISTFESCRTLLMATVLSAAAVLDSSGALAKEASIEERLQVLEDKEEIRALLERYFEFQEGRNFDAFANLFSTDGELILRRGRASGGPAGIRAMFNREPAAASTANGSASAMRHILSNVHIVVNGDTATAMSRWTLLVPTDDGRTRVGGTGRYGDKLVRENGEWKFQQRIIYRDIPVDAQEGAASAG